ncbi:hypothetical protein BJ508DRAFT_332384 [Ascobolus immersus RN42]|uniref:Uncharacterized protein n=1 Tax=Ascobolus immersus RN42 TaxID=1160509 RepID=A0A3N4HTQ7_ASCIM|nr:hypothetical protein BJ508DRAFT_332384 [Ascobolus immersus RN42]
MKSTALIAFLPFLLPLITAAPTHTDLTEADKLAFGFLLPDGVLGLVRNCLPNRIGCSGLRPRSLDEDKDDKVARLYETQLIAPGLGKIISQDVLDRIYSKAKKPRALRPDIQPGAYVGPFPETRYCRGLVGAERAACRRKAFGLRKRTPSSSADDEDKAASAMADFCNHFGASAKSHPACRRSLPADDEEDGEKAAFFAPGRFCMKQDPLGKGCHWMSYFGSCPVQICPRGGNPPAKPVKPKRDEIAADEDKAAFGLFGQPCPKPKPGQFCMPTGLMGTCDICSDFIPFSSKVKGKRAGIWDIVTGAIRGCGSYMPGEVKPPRCK